jgi:hypothetical protein
MFSAESPDVGTVIQLFRNRVGCAGQADDFDRELRHDGPRPDPRDTPIPCPALKRDEGAVRPPLAIDVGPEVEVHR